MKKIILGSTMILGGIYGLINILIPASQTTDLFDYMSRHGTIAFFIAFIIITILGIFIALTEVFKPTS